MISLCVRWESDRLRLEKADLEEKWREIQQTKLSKENQRVLVETSQTSRSQEFSALDRINKLKESFHNKRMEELDRSLAELQETRQHQRHDNQLLRRQTEQLQAELEAEERELEELERKDEEETANLRMTRMMKKNKLNEKLKEQADLLEALHLPVQTFATRTYPTLERNI